MHQQISQTQSKNCKSRFSKNLTMCYFLKIQQYPVNTTYNNTPLYKNEQNERDIIQWRLLQSIDDTLLDRITKLNRSENCMLRIVT